MLIAARIPRTWPVAGAQRRAHVQNTLSLLPGPAAATSGDFASDAVDLGFAPPLLSFFDRCHRFVDAAPSIIKLAEFRMGAEPTTLEVRRLIMNIDPVCREAASPSVSIWTASEGLPGQSPKLNLGSTFPALPRNKRAPFRSLVCRPYQGYRTSLSRNFHNQRKVV